MDHAERLRPKAVSFLGCRYIEGKEFHKINYTKDREIVVLLSKRNFQNILNRPIERLIETKIRKKDVVSLLWARERGGHFLSEFYETVTFPVKKWYMRGKGMDLGAGQHHF